MWCPLVYGIGNKPPNPKKVSIIFYDFHYDKVPIIRLKPVVKIGFET